MQKDNEGLFDPYAGDDEGMEVGARVWAVVGVACLLRRELDRIKLGDELELLQMSPGECEILAHTTCEQGWVGRGEVVWQGQEAATANHSTGSDAAAAP